MAESKHLEQKRTSHQRRGRPGYLEPKANKYGKGTRPQGAAGDMPPYYLKILWARTLRSSRQVPQLWPAWAFSI